MNFDYSNLLVNDVISQIFPKFANQKDEFQYLLLKKWIVLKSRNRVSGNLDIDLLGEYKWHMSRVEFALDINKKMKVNIESLKIFEKTLDLVVFESEIEIKIGIKLLHFILKKLSEEINNLNEIESKIVLYYTLFFFDFTLKFCSENNFTVEKGISFLEIFNFALISSVKETPRGLNYQLSIIDENLKTPQPLLSFQSFLEWDPRWEERIKIKLFEVNQMQRIWKTLIFDYEFQLMVEAACVLKSIEDQLTHLSPESLSVIYGVDFPFIQR